MTRIAAVVAGLALMATGCAEPTSVVTDEPFATTSTVTAAPTTITTAPTTEPTTATTTTLATTTTEPGPPHLTITDPEHKGVVTTGVYTFRGTTDPGCTVSVGDTYVAHVDVDGTWELDLTVPPGRSSTTVTATNPDAGESTSESIRVYRMIIEGDGLAMVSFGDPEADAARELIEALGPPTNDHRVEISQDEYDEDPYTCHWMTGYACFRHVRWLRWDDHGLEVTFSDWGTWNETLRPSPPVFVGYSYWGSADGALTGLATRRGIELGSTVSDVIAAYGDDAAFWADDMPERVQVTIDDPSGRIWGTIDGADWERFSNEGMDSLDGDLPISRFQAGAREDTC